MSLTLTPQVMRQSPTFKAAKPEETEAQRDQRIKSGTARIFADKKTEELVNEKKNIGGAAALAGFVATLLFLSGVGNGMNATLKGINCINAEITQETTCEVAEIAGSVVEAGLNFLASGCIGTVSKVAQDQKKLMEKEVERRDQQNRLNQSV